jgi:hypothetical protein
VIGNPTADGLRVRCLVGNEAARSFYEQYGWTVASTVQDDVEIAAGACIVPMWEMIKRLSV